MIKKSILVLSLIFLLNTCAFAKDVPVKVETLLKISTSDVSLHEGDSITLNVANDIYVNSKLYIRKGAIAEGIVTSLVDNGFTCQEASIYAENFRVKTVNGDMVKLKGIVYKKGRNHYMVTQFLPFGYVFIRGGEAQILPEEDSFILHMEEKNDDL